MTKYVSARGELDVSHAPTIPSQLIKLRYLVFNAIFWKNGNLKKNNGDICGRAGTRICFFKYKYTKIVEGLFIYFFETKFRLLFFQFRENNCDNDHVLLIHLSR